MNKLKLLIITVLMIFQFSFLNNINASAATMSIKMVEAKATILVGSSKTLKIKVTNGNVSKVRWKSSNSAIVSVNSKGLIKGVKNGISNVTAYVPNTKIKAIAVITVNKKPLNASEVFKKVNPSIVYIEVYNKYNEKVASGSGVIASKDGIIITNHHVIVDWTEITTAKIRLANGKTYETQQVIGYDADRDLAVLKIEGATNLTPIEMGDSNKITTGEKIYALGSPLGIQNTITEGIVSNKSILQDKQSFIQHTAPISHGNSGGALVNKYGELIGINVAYFVDGQNMNLAIPVKDYKALNKSGLYTILEVNQEYYVPVSGKGDTNENESNDTFDDADEIVYAEGALKGQLTNSTDFDMFYFLVTDNAEIEITASTIDPALGEDFGVSLYDLDGNVVQHGEITFNEELGRYVCQLDQKIKPGYYHIGVYAYEDTKLPYNKTDYVVGYSIK